MKQLFLIGMVAFLVSDLPASAEEKAYADVATREIPLQDIWAYEMPYTRDIRSLEPTKSTKSLVAAISQSLSSEDRVLSQKGFVVRGDEKEALAEAYKILTQGGEPHDTLPTGGNMWIVFFSRQSGSYVHLTGVKRNGNTFRLQYHFVPHDSKDLTQHFALIPVGNLPAGRYEVATVKLPMNDASTKSGFQDIPDSLAKARVSNSFTFEVDNSEGGR